MVHPSLNVKGFTTPEVQEIIGSESLHPIPEIPVTLNWGRTLRMPWPPILQTLIVGYSPL